MQRLARCRQLRFTFAVWFYPFSYAGNIEGPGLRDEPAIDLTVMDDVGLLANCKLSIGITKAGRWYTRIQPWGLS